jgi:serine/alanine adding enzyme
MPDVRTRILAADESSAWPDSLRASAGFVSLDPWSDFLNKIYRYPTFRIEAAEGDKITGILAISHIKHPLLGNYLTSAPFASYGGFAFDTQTARDALLDEASHLVRDLSVDYAVVRFDRTDLQPPPGWQQQPIYATYLVDLAQNPETLLPDFSSNHRNHINKSFKRGFTISFGHLDLLDDAYEALARSMHELGSPYHSKEYLKEMAQSLGDRLEFAVLYDEAHALAGAGVFILDHGVATNLHANILRRVRSDYAGEFLYWSAISRYCQRGFRSFDLGRSLIGSGNEVFKLKWKPQVRPLAYWYCLKDGTTIPELNQKNPKFRLAIWTWKRLPAFVVRFLGPSLIRGLA